ncbi:MAG: HAD-IIB family hydrolase [Lachnospiraceae bacterium]|nr:HAD-IIB family hydrolase [Lachnospiraceae bacterium]
MEEKTLYVSDLDGTLMHKDLKISDFSVKTINALVEKGVAFTYATARSISSAGTITKDLKLNLPVITRNGAVLADNNTGKIIEKALFTEKEVEMLKEMLPELPKTGFVSCYFGDDMKKVFAGSLHTAELQGYLDYYKDDPSVVTVSALSEMFMGNPGYVTIIGNKDETEPLYLRTREYNGWECLFQKDVYRDEYWLEIAPRNSTKAKSILKLKEEYGFDKLVVFGDSANDITMFKIADEAYAVSNAVDELKALATGIIGSNEEDAVAVYLSKAEPGKL